MQLGRFTIEQLSEGQFELFPDGKINRTPVPESAKSSPGLQMESNSYAGINPVYITDGSHHILLEAGLGWGLDAGSTYTDVSNVRTNLDVFGVTPEDITHVVLSHLHYDHAAGASFTNENASTRPTFPNASYFIQQAEWDFAISQVQQEAPTSQFYNLDDLYRLYADDCFEMIDKNEYEILPGLTVIKTGGHTAGHQITKIRDGGNTAYFLGDLIPTEQQLNHFDVDNQDESRVQVKKMKTTLLREACKENAFLLFYHSIHSTIGQLDKDEDRNYVLKEI
ncbi:MAG: MBL fold metallo-hydrolase [Balneolaceae bacterium]|nr:MBL fold metallo-hydrolase [Balneolaceae bacterium]